MDDTHYEIGASLDLEKLNGAFRGTGRVRIQNFLKPESAEGLYHHLAMKVPWRSLLVANERLMATDVGAAVSPEDEREVLDCAHEGARDGFACLYDVDQLFPEDEPEAAVSSSRSGPLEDFARLMRSRSFLEIVRGITGIAEVACAEIQAMRLRTGHFVAFHAATRTADKSGKRVASFVLNLTPEWKAEWGGLLEFRGHGGRTVEGYPPWFNSLDLFRFPQGHWISAVAPFAGGPQFSISGRFYLP